MILQNILDVYIKQVNDRCIYVPGKQYFAKIINIDQNQLHVNSVSAISHEKTMALCAIRKENDRFTLVRWGNSNFWKGLDGAITVWSLADPKFEHFQNSIKKNANQSELFKILNTLINDLFLVTNSGNTCQLLPERKTEKMTLI